MEGPSDRRRILLAEDDDEVRLTLSGYLGMAGYDVCAVRDGEGLLKEITNSIVQQSFARSFDVVVTDVRMPGFDGLAVLEALRSSGWTRPVVVISALADDDMSRHVERLGKAVLLSKPFAPSDLERIIQRLLPN